MVPSLLLSSEVDLPGVVIFLLVLERVDFVEVLLPDLLERLGRGELVAVDELKEGGLFAVCGILIFFFWLLLDEEIPE